MTAASFAERLDLAEADFVVADLAEACFGLVALGFGAADLAEDCFGLVAVGFGAVTLVV